MTTMSLEPADTFVGREREIGELTAAFDKSLSGQGSLVMLAGEPGIGKTRTAEELASLASERGAEVLWGKCTSQRGAPSLWPWSQIVRSYSLTRDADTVMAAFGHGAARVADGIPEVSELFPSSKPSSAEVDSDNARFMLFDAFASFLKNVSREKPIVLIIDNLHWADDASLQLLEFITPDLAGIPILLVGTYRDMEVSRQHPLSRTLANLNRERSFQRIPLKGLTEQEVGRLAIAGAGTSLEPEIVRSINERSEGNPFFVQEFVHLARFGNRLSLSGAKEPTEWWRQIPEGVREVIGHRLDGLSADCNRVLSIAGVIGREFSFQALSRLVDDLDQDMLLGLLEEAETARIIEEVVGVAGRYQFAHALIGQTLVDELQTTRRVRVHARIAEVFEEIFGDDADRNAGELAHHFAEAETVLGSEKVIRYSVIAGERALAASNYAEAERNFRQAELSNTDLPEDDFTARTYRGLAMVLTNAEQMPVRQAGWDYLVRAFDYYVGVEEIDAAVAIAEIPVAFHRLRGTANLTARAVELLDPKSLRAGYLLTRHSIGVRDELGDFEEDVRLLELAQVIAEAHKDKLLEARIQLSLGQHFVASGELSAAIEHCHRSDALAREVQDPSTEVRAVLFGGRSKLSSFDSTGADKLYGRHTELARQLRIPTTMGLNREAVFGITRDRGQWKTAREIASDERTRTGDQTMYLQRVLCIAYSQSVVPQNDERLVNFIANANSLPHDALMLATSSWLSARSSTFTGLIPEFASHATQMFVEEEMVNGMAECIRVLATKDEVAAAELFDQYSRFSGWWNRRGGNSVDHILGLLSNLCGRPEIATKHFEAAIKDCRNAGFMPELALTLGDYAEMLVGGKRQADAGVVLPLIEESIRIATELGMQPLIERLEVTSSRLAEFDQGNRTAYPDGLSEREIEVLRLVAAGLTNQAIAEQLFISRFTVNRHTANIYGKIDAANRAEAAAYATRYGLLSETPGE